MKYLLNQSILVFLIVTVLLFPFSRIKIEFGSFPLYLPEIPVLLSGIIFLAIRRWSALHFARLDRGILIGTFLFAFGGIISYYLNPHSQTGLGMIKSWFIFPTLFGLLLWHETQNQRLRERMLDIWYFVLCGVALRSLSFLLSGDVTYDGRLQGDYPSPNFLAYLLATAILLSLWRLFSLKTNSMAWSMSLLAMGFLTPAFFATHSYGAWGGLFVAISVAFILKGSAKTFIKKSGYVLALIVVMFATFVFFEQGSEKWQTLVHLSDRSALSSRLMIWQSALKITSDAPIFGIGPGRFQNVYLSYQPFFPPYLEWAVPEPHNIFLAVYLATGLMGLFGFLILIGRISVLLWRQHKKNTTFVESSDHVGLFFGLLTLFLVYGCTDTPLFTTELSYIFFFWLFLAMPRIGDSV